MTESATRPLEWSPARTAVSRVPYLPGLDGMRALAVVAVMVYHANSGWLPGGFLGVEVFFVISGYLITLLLIGEHEKTGRINLGQFWLRRARRLLPALFVLLIGVTVYTTMFRRDALGQLRGDVIAAVTYVSNYYQIWIGQGYTAAGDFAPLRHLWSLAVEEQFYLIWPLVMVGLMRRGRRRLPEVAVWLFLAAVLVSIVTAVLYYSGPIESCASTPQAYWKVAGRCINKTDALYLGTLTRCSGILLGAALAMLWRPVAIMRGPLRTKGHVLDVFAVIGLAGLGAEFWYIHVVTPEGADPWLFRGGFFLTGLASLCVIAAVTHQRSLAGKALGNPLFVWIGVRSYGLYLYHWPIYQMMRRVAGTPLSVAQFATAMAITAVVAEISYRFIETPIRKGHVGRWWRRLQASRDPAPRRIIAAFGAALVALSVFAAASLATAELKPNEIAASLDEAAGSITNLTVPVVTTAGTTDDSVEPTVAPPETTPATGPTTPQSGSTDPSAPVVPVTAPASVPVETTVAPTTAAPPAPIPTLAIGDSVMLGAADELAGRGILVDAAVSRQMKSMIPIVQGLRDTGQLPDAVVVHLGTNGSVGDQTMNEFFTALSGVPRVLVLTIRAPRDYVAANNAKLAALPAQFPNVSVLYWDGLSNDCPGNCFYDDNIHLRQDGQNYYAQLIFDQLGI